MLVFLLWAVRLDINGGSATVLDDGLLPLSCVQRRLGSLQHFSSIVLTKLFKKIVGFRVSVFFSFNLKKSDF